MSSPDRYLYSTTPLNRWGDAPTPPSSSSDPLYEKCTELLSLLSALLVVVVILGAVASGWPLRATVLLGLLQKFIQTEGILLKLNRSFAPLPVVGAWKLFVRGKPESRQKNSSLPIPTWSAGDLNGLTDKGRTFWMRRKWPWKYHGVNGKCTTVKNCFQDSVLHNGLAPCGQPNIPEAQWQPGD